MADWKDILKSGDDHPANEELLNYLNGELTDEEKQALEAKTIDSAFVQEAMEGLQSFKSKDQLDQYVQQLHKNLHQQLGGKRRRQKRSMQMNMPAIMIALAIILICVVGYLLIHFQIFKRL